MEIFFLLLCISTTKRMKISANLINMNHFLSRAKLFTAFNRQHTRKQYVAESDDMKIYFSSKCINERKLRKTGARFPFKLTSGERTVATSVGESLATFQLFQRFSPQIQGKKSFSTHLKVHQSFRFNLAALGSL